ncbi:MAG: hypothetical protein JSW58_07415, partial [Candidatus Latescibacterota bacterium]
DSHPALAEFLEDLVVRDGLSDHIEKDRCPGPDLTTDCFARTTREDGAWRTHQKPCSAVLHGGRRGGYRVGNKIDSLRV